MCGKSTRHNILIGKCSIDFSQLSDFEILELKKNEELLHVELRELMDKISAFETFILPCGDAATKNRKLASLIRAESGEKLNFYLRDLREVVVERDISEKKLQNSSSFKIDIKKFHGYGSSLDIYSFRTEFKKLVEPDLIRSLWADYLKKNLLEGAALNLVKNFEDIDKIWEKLFDVYGNTHLMLQTKLSSLDKFTNLESLKNDEKIASRLTDLLNVMEELCKLASDYGLENDLFYGSGLHKIIELLGRTRQRKFIKLTASLDIVGQEKWKKLVEFIKSELKEREAYVLHEKVARSFCVERRDEKNESNFSGDSDAYVFIDGDHPGQAICHLCDQSNDHVLSFDAKNVPFISYIACKTFAGMTCKDRDKLLFKKKFCNKCLSPGIKYDSKHDCDKQYLCNQPYTKNGKKFEM